MVEPTRPEAMVEFAYIAQEPDELTINKGDIIKDIKIQAGGWWEGTLGDKRGMFPDNFVRLLNDAYNPKELPSDVTIRPVSGRRCKVLFSYQPAHEDELRLEVNDLIDIIGEVEAGWWKGKLKDTIGVFPSNFVTEINDSPAESSSAQPSSSNHKSRSSRVASERESDPLNLPSLDPSPTEPSTIENDAPVLPPKPVKELCRVLFPYNAANEDELTLKEGDVIFLISKEVCDKGWWKGELRGQVGVFPDNFVEVIQQEETSKKPERPPPKSQLCTTNRMRDTITKPTVTNASKNENVDTRSQEANKKPSENSRSGPTPIVRTELRIKHTADGSRVIQERDDKTSFFPPIPGKKPQLPLPIKKPQRSLVSGNQGAKHQESTESNLLDGVDGVGVSRLVPMNYSVPKTIKTEVPEFDNIERSAMLVHPTASRVKAPRRRLPTTVHNRESENPSSIMNGSALMNSHENDLVKSSGQQSRVWESKSKAPWMEELKKNQAKKNVPAPTKSSSGTESLIRPMPSVETVSPTAPESSTKPPTLVGSVRHLSTERQQAPQGSEISSVSLHNKRHSLTTPIGASHDHSPLSEVNQTVQSLKPVVKQQPVHSHSTTSIGSDTTEKSDSSHSPVSSFTTNVHGHLGSNTHYLEVRIKKLERCIEEQREMFTQAIKEITEKLNEERNRRTHIEQELDKLTNLVTQV